MTSKEFLLQMKYIEPLNGLQQILNYTKITSSIGLVTINTEFNLGMITIQFSATAIGKRLKLLDVRTDPRTSLCGSVSRILAIKLKIFFLKKKIVNTTRFLIP
jgi:hypothetical protein